MLEAVVKVAGLIVLGLFIILIGSIVGGVFTYFLWNWLMPIIFGLPIITFWQAIGLNILSAILIKGTTSTHKD
jgi:hypothetical protein